MIFVLAFTGVPMVLWLLAAQSRPGRLVGSAVFAGLGFGAWVTGEGWLGSGIQQTVPFALGALVVLTGIAAPILEPRLVPDLPEPTGFTRARVFVGQTLGFVYTGLLGMLVALLLFLGFISTKAPAVDAILPLPSGLTLDGTKDYGCSDGDSTDACTRDIFLSGPGTLDEIAARIQDQLQHKNHCPPPKTSIPNPLDGNTTRQLSCGKFDAGWVSVHEGKITVTLVNYTDFL